MTTENQSPQNAPGGEEKKLTDHQLRILQIIAGVLAAAAMIVSIYVSSLPIAEDNFVIQYLFLIVFLVVMIGRRQLEQRKRLRLNVFGIAMIDGIIVGIVIYAIPILYPSNPELETGISEPLKILMIVAVLLLMIGLGIVWPYLRYRKRVEEGTQLPVRLPEPEDIEEEETNDEETESNAHLSPIERQIREMSEELGDKKDDSDAE